MNHFFDKMTCCSVDEADNVVNDFVYDDKQVERRSWKFCNSVELPRSEVVFFTQITMILLLIFLCATKLFFYELECEEMSIWIAILSSTVGYILPNPKL